MCSVFLSLTLLRPAALLQAPATGEPLDALLQV
jgi:hypothetical protein